MGALPLDIDDIPLFGEARADLIKLAERARDGDEQILAVRQATQLRQIMDVSQAFDRIHAALPGLDPADAAARVRAHIAAHRKAAGE
jgi:hypothetical protein